MAVEVVQLSDLPAALTMMWLICAIPATCKTYPRSIETRVLGLTPVVPVAEVIELELRQMTGSRYLHGQLFAAAVFLGAGLFMLGLRTWKVMSLNDCEQLVREEPEFQRSASTEERPSPRRSCLSKVNFRWERV